MLDSEVERSNEESSLYSELNLAMFKSIKQLPLSLQETVTLFLLEYSGIALSPNEFFQKYPKAVWVILNDLINKYKYNDTIYKMSVQAQSMSLFIHSLDDHLCDGQIPLDLAKLHLRTTVWNVFEKTCGNLFSELRVEEDLYEENINIYFSSSFLESVDSLDDYLNRSKRQSTLWQIVPLMLAASEHRQSVQFIIEQFIMAYRIIDDLEDWKADAIAGEKSSIYFACSDGQKGVFSKKNQSDEEYSSLLRQTIDDENIFQSLGQVALECLKTSEERAISIGLKTMAVNIKHYQETQKLKWLF